MAFIRSEKIPQTPLVAAAVGRYSRQMLPLLKPPMLSRRRRGWRQRPDNVVECWTESSLSPVAGEGGSVVTTSSVTQSQSRIVAGMIQGFGRRNQIQE
nr:hypothetical protein Itr_chr05CG16560 [Ipomoea trifida]